MQQISATIPDQFKSEIDTWRKANPGASWGKLIIDGYRAQKYVLQCASLQKEVAALSHALAKLKGL